MVHCVLELEGGFAEAPPTSEPTGCPALQVNTPIYSLQRQQVNNRCITPELGGYEGVWGGPGVPDPPPEPPPEPPRVHLSDEENMKEVIWNHDRVGAEEARTEPDRTGQPSTLSGFPEPDRKWFRGTSGCCQNRSRSTASVWRPAQS